MRAALGKSIMIPMPLCHCLQPHRDGKPVLCKGSYATPLASPYGSFLAFPYKGKVDAPLSAAQTDEVLR